MAMMARMAEAILPLDNGKPFKPINIAILTVSDTRGPQDDTSGDILAARVKDAGHALSARALDVVVEEVRGQGKGHPPILPVLSMIDLRRTLHREAREANPKWPVIPLASAVEQCAVERKPVGAFAPRSPAARAITQLWTAIERKLAQK